MLVASHPPADHVPPALPSFDERWAQAISDVKTDLVECLKEVTNDPVILSYCEGLGLYLKVPYLLSHRLAHGPLRTRIDHSLARHIVGMKLLDDAADLDTDLDSTDLVCCGLHLLHSASGEMSDISKRPDLCANLEAEMRVLTKGVMQTKHDRSQDFRKWRFHSCSYGGGFLRIYGRLANFLVSDDRGADLSGRFSFAFGTIITIADDIVDYTKKGERAGNLGYLLETGSVQPAQIIRLLEAMRFVCKASLTGTPDEQQMKAITDQYVDDVIQRIIPDHLDGVTSSGSD
ncbi:hypothetical protein [Shimia ponticola]|uniref:hypothetical protein n=1 Tax=Shimia ponticola TaxID=2582893 RepID=UPI0011BF2F66|nr:hypothetical protein [Shimia ponticola]